MIELTGVFPPIPTSFDDRGEVDADGMRRNLAWWNGFGLSGCVVLGSNGEAELLENDERVRVVSLVRSSLPGDRLLIAGSGRPSTRATIRLTNDLARAGADMALVLPPHFYKAQMVPPTLIAHYMAVADASSIPIIIYNMPANTGVDVCTETILRIAEHENVVGVKDSGGNLGKMASLVSDSPSGFSVLAGSAGFLLPALSVGAMGGVLALANIAPQVCIDIVDRFTAGDVDGARRLQARWVEVNAAVTRRWGVPALKAALDRIGLCGGAVRPPLQPLEPEKRAMLDELLRRAGVCFPKEDRV